MHEICTDGGFDVEGEGVDGEDFDPISGKCYLAGALFQVHGWMVEVAEVEPCPLWSCER
jgi:hypothetical protein